MKTLLIVLFLALALPSAMLAMACCGFTYIPPSVDPPSISGDAAFAGGTLLAPLPTPTLFGPGFLLQGPMDVQANADTLQLQYTVTAAFTPKTTTQYWVYSFLSDFIWSNLSTTQAVLDSVTSDAYIGSGTCPGAGCGILAEGSTSLHLDHILYDPASTYSAGVNASSLFSFWGTTSSVGLVANQSYTLVHQTTFNISGLASGEVIRIDLPESSELSGTPEPATWGLALLGIGLTGYCRRRRGR